MAKRGQFGAHSGLLASQVIQSTTAEWTGDGTNNREIGLGDDYDLVLVFENRSQGVTDHMAMCYALGGLYGTFSMKVAGTVAHVSGASSDTHWQGKMTGADASKILLGNNGGSGYGTNRDTVDYRAIGFKLPA